MADTRRDSGFGARNSGETPRTDLEAVIDAVAREMTGGEPSGALRARVLEQIQHGRRHPVSSVPRWAWAGAAAALVLAVATSVWLVRHEPLPGGTATTVARQQVALPGAVGSSGNTVPAAASNQAAAVPAASAMRPRRQTAIRAAAAEAVDADRDSHQLPALAAIEPLRIAAVEPAALQMQRVEIAPMAELPSIDIPSLDRGSNETQSADPKKEN